MIYEIAELPVKAGQADAFANAFRGVAHLLSRAKGYRGHLLGQGMESPEHFKLIVRWQTVEDHTDGFEPSRDHEEFLTGLQVHLAGEPVVHHVRAVVTDASDSWPEAGHGAGGSPAPACCAPAGHQK